MQKITFVADLDAKITFCCGDQKQTALSCLIIIYRTKKLLNKEDCIFKFTHFFDVNSKPPKIMNG